MTDTPNTDPHTAPVPQRTGLAARVTPLNGAKLFALLDLAETVRPDIERVLNDVPYWRAERALSNGEVVTADEARLPQYAEVLASAGITAEDVAAAGGSITIPGDQPGGMATVSYILSRLWGESATDILNALALMIAPGRDIARARAEGASVWDTEAILEARLAIEEAPVEELDDLIREAVRVARAPFETRYGEALRAAVSSLVGPEGDEAPEAEDAPEEQEQQKEAQASETETDQPEPEPEPPTKTPSRRTRTTSAKAPKGSPSPAKAPRQRSKRP